jgi:hypothetical protein
MSAEERRMLRAALTPAEALDLAQVAEGFREIIAARDAEDAAEARRRRSAERDAAETERRAARSGQTRPAVNGTETKRLPGPI